MSNVLMRWFAAPRPERRRQYAWPRRVAAACALALMALTSSLAFALPQEVKVETTRHGDLVDVDARAIVRAPLGIVWDTLTDYNHLADFVPGLKKSRVLSQVGTTTTVEQSGEARFLFLVFPIEVTLESVYSPPTLEVRRIAGNLRHLQGRYEVETLADPALIRLSWTGTISPERQMPPLIGQVVMRHSISQQFLGMVREIERRAAAHALPNPVQEPK
jgi:ribosome-associated toxin RatA of RatAB toxin-antitoxin module